MIHPGLICWYQIESIYNISHWYQIVYNIEHIISTSGLLYTYVIYIYIIPTNDVYIYTYIYILYIFIRNIYIYIIIIYLHIMYIYIYILHYHWLTSLLRWHIHDTSSVAPVLPRSSVVSAGTPRRLAGDWPGRSEKKWGNHQKKTKTWGFMGIYRDLMGIYMVL
jgi:hypothetical protein